MIQRLTLVSIVLLVGCTVTIRDQPLTPSIAARSAPVESPRASSAASASPAVGLVLGPTLDIAAPCGSDRAYVTTETVVWQACDLSAKVRSAQIYEYSRTSERTRLLYEAPGSGMTLVGVSEEWIVWFEYADVRTAHDSTLYAWRRSDQRRITVDDWHDHPTLASLSDAALDGADIYWTVPRVENGVWHGALLRRRLPDGAPAVVMQAPVGAIIGYPSAHGGLLAFEYSVEIGAPKTIVRYLGTTGGQHDVGNSASSEPTVGDGFIVFKRAERYDAGELASYTLANGVTTGLGPGEQPRADGPFVTWIAETPRDGGIRLGRPLDNCIISLPQGAQITETWPTLGSGYFAWAFRDDARPPAEARRIRVAKIRSVKC